jgi:hypothetical protein
MYGNFTNDQRSDRLVIAVAADRSFQQVQPLCSVGLKLRSRGRVGGGGLGETHGILLAQLCVLTVMSYEERSGRKFPRAIHAKDNQYELPPQRLRVSDSGSCPSVEFITPTPRGSVRMITLIFNLHP